ncbi:hypothetical protein F4779DRAFT_618522 [Xylariaceae sp. FL0662B]|nr:hypothetical protein F4779DRAFT_618522 [Xylariaceae sp. FL0662B]
MRLKKCFHLAWCIFGVANAVAGVYTNLPDVPRFIAQLGLNDDIGRDVSSVLYGYDVDSISRLATREKASLACLVSSAVFGGNFFNSTSASYDDLISGYWSESCWLEPRCIVQPRTAVEVSKAMLIVTFLGSRFSVRSGGHNSNVGFSGVNGNGVLIDLVNLSGITLSSDGSIASLGPGNRFDDAYKALNSTGKTIVGGRVADVGVGGYYLGGGLSHFSSLYGMAADNVRDFEIVLADASIVHANSTSNPDLWWALKGGGANFGKHTNAIDRLTHYHPLNRGIPGIVTNYDVETIQDTPIWFEAFLYDASQNERLLELTMDYVKAADDDPSAGLVLTLTPTSGLVGFIYGKNVVRPDVYKMFYDVPSVQTYINSTVGNMVDLSNAFAAVTPLDPARRLVSSVAHRWDLETLKESYAMFLNVSAEATRRFNASLVYNVQPFTSAAVKYASQKGGNPLGLSEISQNLFGATIQWDKSGDDEAAFDAILDVTKGMEIASQRNNANLTFRFMNDANHVQNVLASYGPDNFSTMKSIAEKFDPFRVFQELQNGGFLLNNL